MGNHIVSHSAFSMFSLVMMTIVPRSKFGMLGQCSHGHSTWGYGNSIVSETLGTVMNNEMKHHVQFITMTHSTSDNTHTYIRKVHAFSLNLSRALSVRNFPLAKGHLPQNILISLCQYTSGPGNL